MKGLLKIVTGWWLLEKVLAHINGGGEIMSVQDVTEKAVASVLQEPMDNIAETMEELSEGI